jgi:hypothetical protein
MNEFVKLIAPIQLVPKEYRLTLAEIAALMPTSNAEIMVAQARTLLTYCGIVEAMVPKQHAESLSIACSGAENE